MVPIGKKIPSFQFEVYQKGQISTLALSTLKGKWIVLFFYPADFTFVCPTELKDMSDHYEKFIKAGAEIISISTDSVHVHRAWAQQHEDIKKIAFPMASDRAGKFSRLMGVYDEEKGVSMRASFIVDPDGKIVAVEMTDEAIGRNAAELLRKLEAAIAVRESDGGFCPANWHRGEELIRPK
ncbi:MAG: peroxiredoxin [Spirochaetes bacterium]|nr:peroxiredoxin [Spirochaetota bacterium]